MSFTEALALVIFTARAKNCKYDTFDAIVDGVPISSTVCPRMTVSQWIAHASQTYNVSADRITVENAYRGSTPPPNPSDSRDSA